MVGAEDRRVRRTRRLLREALLVLILERGYDAVTVQDILDRADVGRATFYAHFRDKDDLLISGLAEGLAGLREQLAGHELREASAKVFEHAASQRRLWRALVGRRAGSLLLRYGHEVLVAAMREHLHEAAASHGREPSVPTEVVSEYVVSALVALLAWWVDGPSEYTAQQMSEMFLHLTEPVVHAALGVEEASVESLRSLTPSPASEGRRPGWLGTP